MAGSMDTDPDFVITIDGQDVVDFTSEWEMLDDEQGMSEITVELKNPEGRNSGRWKYGQDLFIRFGYMGDLSGKAYLPVAEVAEMYRTGGDLSITVKGRDESSKMAGGKHKGNHGAGKDLELIRKDAEAHGMKIASEGVDSVQSKKGPVYNENSHQLSYRLGRACAPGGSQSGGAGGQSPTNPLSKEKSGSVPGSAALRDKAQLFSSAERVPDDGEGRDKNRADNHSNQAQQSPVTAKLELKGYPTLRAKTTVAIMGVGPEASGTYYVQKCRHTWRPDQGYRTVADLIRGGAGQGGVGGDPPLVMYADIWNKGSMYLGPRKSNDSPQATFTFGEGRHVVSFEYRVAPQAQRHGGEPKDSVGQGIDLRKKGEAYMTHKLSGESEGQSGGTGLPGGAAGPGAP